MFGLRKRQREVAAASAAASSASPPGATGNIGADADPRRRNPRPLLSPARHSGGPARHIGYSCSGCNEMPILGVRHLSLAQPKNDVNYVAPSFCSRCILGPLGADYAAVRVPRPHSD